MKAQRLNAKDRKIACQAIDRFNTYNDGIPIDAMMNSLSEVGLTLVQEDNTRWAGMLLGAQGRAMISMAKEASKNGEFYEPLQNAMCLTWYKMQSGRYEVVAYIS